MVACFLIRLADELANGRAVEAGDLVISQLQCLSLGIQTGNWNMSNQFLAFKPREFSLVANETVDVALRLAKKEKRRNEELRATGSSRGANADHRAVR